MIIKDEIVEEENKFKTIFEMLEEVKLPKNYKFAYNNSGNFYVEIVHFYFFGLCSSWVADIYLDGEVLIVGFEDESDLRELRSCFINSKTKFKLMIRRRYY